MWSTIRDFATVTNGTAGRFIGVKQLADREVLVNKSSNIYGSTGWATNPATARFAVVLVPTTAAPRRGSPPSPLDVLDNYLATTTCVAGTGIDFTPSRYIWVSTDSGQTFNVVWDMATDHVAVLDISTCTW